MKMTKDIIEKSISNATNFLISRRSIDKLWHDFSLTPGESDEWVSGYVGSGLAESGSKGIRKIVRETWNVLGWQRLSGHGG